MNTINEIQKLIDEKNPISAEEKHQYGKRLVSGYNSSQFVSELFKWYIGGILYRIVTLGLHNYVYGKSLSKNAFCDELGIAPSTAQTLIKRWEFYVVKNKIPLDKLKNASTYNLGRALAYLKDKDKDEVKRIVDLAERGKLSRIDFLLEINEIK